MQVDDRASLTSALQNVKSATWQIILPTSRNVLETASLHTHSYHRYGLEANTGSMEEDFELQIYRHF
uniref:Uncharacterized protein n=1 Tax=Thermosporothrix sp. COM3 TaxID=2490863 RepID=A0A455SDK4_9CHLR|nr:hypothetical protein KTC_12780 [Thermosporothrix sp. COM3]